MDRRAFIGTVGAVACAGLTMSAAPSCAIAAPAMKQMSGRKVRFQGYLQPAGKGQRHFFTLTADQRSQPVRDASHADWRGDSVRILPKNTDTFRTSGLVWVEGTLQVGHFGDVTTGLSTGAVLLDARLV